MAVQNENVSINIGSNFDAKGFKEAETSAERLNKTIKNLAATIGVAYGTQAVVNFGKQSVKAFLADEAAATKLSQAVKNLGMEFANPYIKDYISKLEQTTKVADDQLRPAFQALLQQTGNLSESQKILSTAIETSRGSGVDLATVANDLAQAYVGNTKGLKKYYLGLTNAQLKAKSFVEIQKIMNDQFAGSNAAYLNTYSGEVGVLSLAWQNFQEKVGGTLLTLASFGDGENGHKLNLLAASLDKIGSAIQLIGKGKEAIFGLFDITGKNGLLSKFNPYPQGGTSNTPESKSINKYQQQLAKIEADRKKQNDAIVKSNKALTAEQKKQAALKKAGTVFDLEQIQLVAALKGKLSDEERIRAEAQLALLNGNVDLATKLTNQILMAQDSTGNLAKFLATLPDARNPFQYLDAYLSFLAGKAASIITGQPSPSVPSATASAAPMPSASELAAQGAFSTLVAQGAGASGGFSPVVAAAMAPTVVNVVVQGSVIKEQELIAQIQNGTQLASLSGSPSQIGRIAGMFG